LDSLAGDDLVTTAITSAQMTSVRRERAGVLWPHVLCGAFVILWLDVGVAADTMARIPGIAKVGILGCWLALAAVRSPVFFGDLVLTGWPLATMMLIVLMYSAEIAESDQYLQGLGYLLIAFALFCFYSSERFRRERTVLLFVMLADLAVTGMRTLVTLQTEPLLSRYLATTEEIRTTVYGSLSFSGLGGYGYAYSLAATLVLLSYFLVRSTRKFTILVVMIVGAVVLIEMAFATSILLAVVVGGGFLVQDLIHKSGLRIILVGVALIGWASGFYSAVLRTVGAVGSLTPDVQVRLIDLARFLNGESSAGSDLGSRLDLWTRSVVLFLSNGPFGLAGSGRTNQATGGHSQWLDFLASYGILTALLVLFFALSWLLLRRRLPTEAAASVGRGWLFLLVVGLVNTLIFSTIVLTWMFLLPALAMWFGERRATSRVVES